MLDCNNGLPQFFGLGSKARKTSTHVPDPYGIEVGNPSEVPLGYEERWMFNIHAIDTLGAVDAMGCTECRYHLMYYNFVKISTKWYFLCYYCGNADVTCTM